MPFLIPVIVAIATGASTWGIIGAIASATIGAIGFFAPKPKGPARQAQVLEISFGETPREVFVGIGATGGQAVNAFNYDDAPDDNAFEVFVIKLSDVRMTNLEGFIIGENYYGFSGDGAQPAFSVGGTDYLEIWFRDGSPGQTPPASVVAASGGEMLSTDTMTGCAYVVVRYKGSDTVWSGGRPRFRWYAQGAYCYDPRLGIANGGTQDPDDETTWAPTVNPIVIALNYRHGFYNNGELVCGRGIPWDKAVGDFDEYVAQANICDETVALKAGGTQTRYACGMVIASDEAYSDVLEKFAASAGGFVVSRRGRVEIITGAARTPHDGFTDRDIVIGEPIEFSAFLPDTERVNTVIARYPEGDQFWNTVSAPMRRVDADLIADGNGVAKPYEMTLDLEAVYDGIRAQRIAEIRRREGRLEITAVITLPPRYSNIEVGDWIPWTSSRYLGGATTMFRVMKDESRVGRSKRLTLRQINEEAFEWDPDTDEIDNGSEILPGADLRGLTDDTLRMLSDGETRGLSA